LYVGISNYDAEHTKKAASILRALGTPCLIHQPRYNMLQREPETHGVIEAAHEEGLGVIVFSPMAQGLLTDRYLSGIPEDSRAAFGGFLNREQVTAPLVEKLKRLDAIAKSRGQSLAQLAISWVLRSGKVTSALIGASKPEQIAACAGALSTPPFSADELSQIENGLTGGV
jgi:L-glyceraldehyde 3-phosphate reductase